MHSVDVAFLVFYRLGFRLDSSKNSQMLINHTTLLLRIEVMPNTPASLRHSSIQAPFGGSRYADRSDGAPRSLVQVILSRYHEIIYIYSDDTFRLARTIVLLPRNLIIYEDILALMLYSFIYYSPGFVATPASLS